TRAAVSRISGLRIFERAISYGKVEEPGSSRSRRKNTARSAASAILTVIIEVGRSTELKYGYRSARMGFGTIGELFKAHPSAFDNVMLPGSISLNLGNIFVDFPRRFGLCTPPS